MLRNIILRASSIKNKHRKTFKTNIKKVYTYHCTGDRDFDILKYV